MKLAGSTRTSRAVYSTLSTLNVFEMRIDLPVHELSAFGRLHECKAEIGSSKQKHVFTNPLVKLRLIIQNGHNAP